MYYIGLDVGGTTFKAGVVTEDGRIVHKDAMPTGIERPYQEIIADMAALCKTVAADAGIEMSEIKSIGVGVPGLFDNKTGMIPFCTNLGWHDIPFVAEMKKHLDTPVYGDNDATVAGLAESVAGVSAGIKDSVFLTLGTGVGGGIIIDGKPYSGAHGGRHVLCRRRGADSRVRRGQPFQHRHDRLCAGLCADDGAGCGAGVSLRRGEELH